MTTNEVYDFIKLWIKQVIDIHSLTEYKIGTKYKIVRSNVAGNVPRPQLPYIVMHDPFTAINDAGLGTTSNWQYTNEPLDEGEVTNKTNYEVTLSIEDIGNNGYILRKLINSLNRQDIKDLWNSNCIGFLRNEPIVPTTDLTENVLEKRALLDIIINYADIETYDPAYFNTVDYTYSRS